MFFLTGMSVLCAFIAFLFSIVEYGRTRQLDSSVFDVGPVVHYEIRFIDMALFTEDVSNEVVSKFPFRFRVDRTHAILFCYWVPMYIPHIVTPLAGKCKMRIRAGEAEITVRLQLAAFIGIQIILGILLVGIIHSGVVDSNLSATRIVAYSAIGVFALAAINALFIGIEIKRARIATNSLLRWLSNTGKLRTRGSGDIRKK